MKTLLNLSTFCLALFLLTGCAEKDNGGTYVNISVINKSGISEGGREIYLFKESSDVILNKKPSEALRVKVTDQLGEVQFNLENPNRFEGDESAVFSFRVMEYQDGDFVTLGSFEREIKAGDIVNQTITLK